MLCLAWKGKFCLIIPAMPLGISFFILAWSTSSTIPPAGWALWNPQVKPGHAVQHPCLPSRETNLSFPFSSIFEANSSSPRLCQSLWTVWSIPQCPGDSCEGGSRLLQPRAFVTTTHHTSPAWTRSSLRPGLKAFPLAASLDAFCRKIKHHEKIKPCHFPLQIIQGCNEKESIKAEHLRCKVFPVVSTGNSCKSLALSRPQHHLLRAEVPEGPRLCLSADG